MKVWLRSLWLLLIGTALSTTAVAEPKVIRLQPEALVKTMTYTVGQIADLSAMSPSLRKKIASIKVGLAPRPGQSVWVTKNDLYRRLSHDIPSVASELTWSGELRVRVRSVGVDRDGAELVLQAERAQRGWLAGRHEEFEVATVRELDRMTTPAGNISYRPKLPRVTEVGKRMSVLVDIDIDGTFYTTVPVWFSVSVYEPVWEVLVDAEKQSELAAVSMRRITRDIAGLREKPLKQVELSGYRLTRDIAASSILTEKDVELQPLVAKGDPVSVIASYGLVSLQVKGTAMTDGYLNELITVQNPQSEELFTGVVVGQQRVRVE